MNTNGILIEVPHMGDPSAYGLDRESVVRLAHERAARGDWRVFERSTPREVIEQVEADIDDGDDVELCEDLRADAWALAGRFGGLDTPIHRGPVNLAVTDDAKGWRAGEGDEFAAALEFTGRDLSACYWIESADEARDLYARLTGDSAPAIGKCGPVWAARALRIEAERLGWMEPEPVGDNDHESDDDADDGA